MLLKEINLGKGHVVHSDINTKEIENGMNNLFI